MSAFSSVFTGMSGLMAFSQGLDVISNNVTNLNTPGYKQSDLLFRDAFYKHQGFNGSGGSLSGNQNAGGVAAKTTTLNFLQGSLQQTGNKTDLAIDGNGFFILNKDGETFYTRAGQFEFDENDYLVNRGDDARVQSISSSGALADINIADHRTRPAQATTLIEFKNNLSTGDDEHEINDIEVFDAVGNIYKFDIKFEKDAVEPRVWNIEVDSDDGTVSLSKDSIRFQVNGSPEDGHNEITLNIDGNEIVLNFGEPGSFSGATSFSGGTTSTLAVDSIDGLDAGSLLDIVFDKSGGIELKYSNGEVFSSATLALAWFSDLQSLNQIGNGLFSSVSGQQVFLAAATQKGMGEIVAQNIESSNVDLTQEFSDLIVVQRGYQASSQILSASNEMMQQLIEIGKK